MTWRVLFDFGDIELTVYHWSKETDESIVIDGALKQLEDRGMELPNELSVSVAYPCPEWDNEN